MNFSQRKGLKPIKNIIQKDSIDSELKTDLWNNLTVYYFRNVGEYEHNTSQEFLALLRRIWIHYFHKNLDEFPFSLNRITDLCKKHFYDSPWNENYDFIEFVILNYSIQSHNLKFIELCNSTLEQNVSAYRIIDFIITEVTGDEEINSIETALENANNLSNVRIHLRRSLELMTDRKNPDYRNSIKESISAVESLCKELSGDKNASFAQALNEIEKIAKLHPALKKSFSHLYGYTSDSSGIRHALMEEDNLTQDDAKYMLVSCSAFINYLVSIRNKK